MGVVRGEGLEPRKADVILSGCEESVPIMVQVPRTRDGAQYSFIWIVIGLEGEGRAWGLLK